MDSSDSRGCFNNFDNSKNSGNAENFGNAHNECGLECGTYLDNEKGRDFKICGHLRHDDHSFGSDVDRSRLVIIENSLSGRRQEGEGHEKGTVPGHNNGEGKNWGEDLANGGSASRCLASPRSFPQLVDNPVENDTDVTPPL